MLLHLTLNGIIAGSIYALVAIGFCIIYKTVRFFHFAHGAVYTTGAYVAYSCLIILGINSFIAFLFATVCSSVLGIAIDRVVYSPLRNNNAPGLVFLIASFGIFIFIQNVIQLLSGAQILTLRTGPIVEGHEIFGSTITNIQIMLLIVTVVLFSFVWLVVNKTKMGKAIRAVADDPVGASISGVYPEKVILFAFALGSALAGIAGALISLETNIEPTMGMNSILKGIIASIIGGIGSIPGAVLGGFFLGIVENLGIWKIQAGWKDTIAFAVLIIFMLVRPEGLLGKRNNKERL